jgi:two-component system sensor histidine kinase KdpD
VSGEPVRPDPDRLLAQVERQEARALRGHLRIFFGASAGVGKTYAMLEAARGARARGTDVVVGYVEPHGRVETERLLEGLPHVPTLAVRHGGAVRQEFDLDAALSRRAAITLVDELAHSNVTGGDPPPRHPKRWQDIEELLQAGLDVWTTMNVQHLESLNDVVAGITGVRQGETVPDHVFDEADEIELIDLPPDDLLERLRAGKVYVAAQAQTALERFFRKPNLIALRELALRRTADRVDAAAREYAGGLASSRPWLARDRFLIAVAPDDQAEALVRIGKRFADALDAEWTVVSVETPAMQRLGEAQRNRRIDVLRLAESLGAETVTLDGPVPASTILEYARLRNVSRIVVGEPRRRGLLARLRPSTSVALLRDSAGVDVSVIARRGTGARTADRDSAGNATRGEAPTITWSRYGGSIAIVAISTALAVLLDRFVSITNVAMLYVLASAIAGLRLGRGPAALSAVLGILCLNFFFIPPRLSFEVAEPQYIVTFVVMLAVALTIATLMANVRQQTRVAGARERRTSMLYAMSRELAVARGIPAMQEIAVKHVAETFAARVALLLPDDEDRVQPPRRAEDQGLPGATYGEADASVAQWVYDHGRPAGLGADALPGAAAAYLPLPGTRKALGVLAVLPANRRRVLLPEQRHLLETFAGQVALALERAQLAEQAATARVAAEKESFRNTLLASISHDLRTPLAVISAASSALADPAVELGAATRRDLAVSIAARAEDMAQMVGNVLDLTRLESGQSQLRRDWETLDDLVGLARGRLGDRLQGIHLVVTLPEDLPPVHVDAHLVTQLFANLLENAARHTPPGTAVRINARAGEGVVQVVVEDDGPGLPPGDPERLFAKFQRGRDESDVPGAGLGLAICRAIVEAHGGQIHAGNRGTGEAGGTRGARFEFTLPASEAPA